MNATLQLFIQRPKCEQVETRWSNLIELMVMISEIEVAVLETQNSTNEVTAAWKTKGAIMATRMA